MLTYIIDDCLGNTDVCQSELTIEPGTNCGPCLQVTCPPTNIVWMSCTNVSPRELEQPGVIDSCCTNWTVTYSPPGPFAPGSHTLLNYIISDCLGNTDMCQSLVIILPGTNCEPCLQVTCPPTNIVMMSCSDVSPEALPQPGVIDPCCTNWTVTYSPPGPFAPGSHTLLNYIISDCLGNTDVCQSEVTIEPGTNCGPCLQVTCPPTNIVMMSCSSVSPQALPQPGVTDSCCTNWTVTYSPLGPFAPGSHTLLTYIISDCLGNTDVCQSLVIIQPGTNCGPCLQVTCPPTNIVMMSCANVPAGALPQPGVIDPCCTNWTVIYSPPGPFAPGSHTLLSYIISDCLGNTDICQSELTIQPGTNCGPCLQVTCPPTNIVVMSCANIPAAALPQPGVIDSCCTNWTVTYSPSGPFAPGSHTLLSYIISDCLGNTDVCQSIVIIEPGTNCGPCLQVTCPPTNIVVMSCANIPAAALPQPGVIDSCCTNWTVAYSPPGPFAPGSHTFLNYIISDCLGNTDTCRSQVIIQPGTNCEPCLQVTCPPTNIVWMSCTNVSPRELEQPGVIDSCCTNWTVTYSPPGPFAPGTHTLLNYIISDCLGNTDVCQSELTIEPGTNCGSCLEVICPPTNIVFTSCTNIPVGALPQPSVTNLCCTNYTITYVPHGPFVVGTTTPLTYIISDSCGDTDVCQSVVTVNPALGCGGGGCLQVTCPPTNIVYTSCTNILVGDLPQPYVTNICCTNYTITYVPHGPFVPGTTTPLTYIISDSCGDTDVCQSVVTVHPGLGCGGGGCLQVTCPPTNIVLTSCTNIPVGALPQPSVTNLCCTNYAITYVPPGPFAPGTTNNLTYIITDSCGDTDICQSVLTVHPGAGCSGSGCLQVTCPPTNIVLTSCTNVPASALPQPSVLDLCCTNWNVRYVPPGPFLPNTTNHVTCIVSDSCGNTNLCPFTLTVACELHITGGDQGNQQILYWSGETNLVLEYTTNLDSPNWMPVTNGVNVNAVIVTNSLPVEFFRLSNP